MRRTIIAGIVLTLVLLGAWSVNSMNEKKGNPMMEISSENRTAVFAGGCFWCVESDFEKVDGVLAVVSGYTGGDDNAPTYEKVSAGRTGHVEAIQIQYDPSRITYQELIDVFWRHVDPTDPGGQFVDRGPQYRTVIFYGNEEERQIAEKSKAQLEASNKFSHPIATEILPLGPFYPAEAYHQGYYQKNPIRYRWYRSGSGRDSFLKRTWNDEKTQKPDQPGKAKNASPMESDTSSQCQIPVDAELREKLTSMQYKVTCEGGTEPPFDNAYWNNHEAGIYVDIVSGEPLFSSIHKFDSGTGWPSFTQPLEAENILEKSDTSLFMERTEVRSKHADSHLGHVFPDGPAPTGRRYCINSASLRFIPVSALEKEGYGNYLKLFEKEK